MLGVCVLSALLGFGSRIVAAASPAGQSWHVVSGSPGSPSLLAPRGLTVDGRGTVYVADAGHGQIQKISPSGRLLVTFGRQGTGAGRLDTPTDVTIDAAGNVYVADSGNNRVEEFSPSGRVLVQWGKPVGRSFPSFQSPTGLTVDAAGNLYVADRDNRAVEKLSRKGKGMGSWFINAPYGKPTSVAVDGRGNIYTACGALLKFDASGRRGNAWAVTPAAKLSGVDYVTTDRSGNVYAVQTAADTIVKLSAAGRTLATWSPHGLRHVSLDRPAAVGLDAHGNLYVTDAGERVLKIAPGGNVLARWGAHGRSAIQLSRPASVAFGPDGTAYVADAGNARIEHLEPQTSPAGTWRSAGTWSANLGHVSLVAVGGSGNIFVVDTPDDVIGKFSNIGSLESSFTLSDSGGKRHDPRGIALDARGNLFVSENFDHRIHVLSSGGQEIASFPTSTSIQGLDMDPRGLAVDSRERTYVADTANGRIITFSPSGRPIAVWGSPGSGVGQFNQPSAVAIDAHGDVYVADTGNSRIQELSPSGTVRAVWGTYGAATAQFARPASLALDTRGNLLVADTNNDRLQLLRQITP